jgi:hypothetical protein
VKLALSIVLLSGFLGAGCDSSSSNDRIPTDTSNGPTVDLTTAVPGPVKVVAVGDISCGPPEMKRTPTTCRQADTARLTRSIDPDYVLALGDFAYPVGADFTYYDRSWGSLKPITRPLLGNHDYGTRGASGYYGYFGGREPGYYAWNAGGWRVYNLNSNCSQVDCQPELAWLEQDLADHPQTCSIIAMHHSRFSSSDEHGSSPWMEPFWEVAQRHGVDIALGAHDHAYERFARLDPAGNLDEAHGIQSFVVGTGGKSLYHLERQLPGSLYYQRERPGVLTLVLGDGKWTWEYRTVDGRVRDSGAQSCL